MAFVKATRRKSKLRLALAGPSGAGKTLSALLLAYGITGDWGKIALIDTEHGRARFYANRTDFETGEFLYQGLTPPYSPERYKQMVAEGAQAVGPDGVVIVDSFSHAWDNEGGVLDIKSGIEKNNSKTSFSAWDEAGKVQNNLVNTILSTDCHVILTLRTKTAYTMEQNERGKTVPVKLGLAPVQRENMEYELDIVLNIARNHIACAAKDTTFLDTWQGVITPELGTKLRDWLDNVAEPDRCADCQQLVQAVPGKWTAQQMVEGTLKNYGRKLCYHCMAKEIRRRKEAAGNAASGVSDNAGAAGQ